MHSVQLPQLPGLTPEHLRESSNLAHAIEGVLIMTAGAIAVAQAFDKLRGGRREYLWQSLLTAAGVFLMSYLATHHGLGAVPAVLRYAWSDMQQRQHLLLAMLALFGGLGAYVDAGRRIRGLPRSWFAAVFSTVLVAMGVVFLVHPQHGSGEAVARARAMHVMIGALFCVTGVAHGAWVLRPGARAFSIGWPLLLAATGFAIATYREPPEAYEYEMEGHERTDPTPALLRRN